MTDHDANAREYLQHHREHLVDRARAWTEHQAARLEISPEAITTAIERGWTPAQIDAVQSAAELLLSPGKAKLGPDTGSPLSPLGTPQKT